MFFLGEKNGKIMVYCQTTGGTEQTPITCTTYWPLIGDVITPAQFTERFGKPLPLPVIHQPGFPGFWLNFTGYSSDDIHLETAQECSFNEETPIPCPKVRAGVETRFYRGYWQKYLQSKGWVAA